MNREHAAQDRKWFTSYTPFASEVRTLRGKRLSVLGIGTVCLPLQTQRDAGSEQKRKMKKKKSRGLPSSASPTTSGGDPSSSVAPATPNTTTSSSLVLENVLHVPGLSYNVVSALKLNASGSYTTEGMLDDATIIDNTTGLPVGFTEMALFMPKFRLAGQAKGMSSANEWSRSETFDWNWQDKQRWERMIGNSKMQNPSLAKAPKRATKESTAADKKRVDRGDSLDLDRGKKDEAQLENPINKLDLSSDDGAEEWITDDDEH